MNVLIAILGCEAHWDRFNAQRQTWADSPLVHYFTGHELGVHDGYESLPAKTRAICQWAVKNRIDHLFKCDTDTYVSLRRLLASRFYLHDYIGYKLEDKNYASGGAGYWLSRKAIGIVAHVDISGFRLEDEMVGTILARSGITLHHDPRYALYADVLPQNDVISRHLSSREPYRIEMMKEAHDSWTGRRDGESTVPTGLREESSQAKG